MLADFERHLETSVRVPKHFVLTGLRGTGKTVLLREFQKLLVLKRWLYASRELDETANSVGPCSRRSRPISPGWVAVRLSLFDFAARDSVSSTP